jgi:ligand-binding sensor domain-containing protein/AraC-like DNA-binding protein
VRSNLRNIYCIFIPLFIFNLALHAQIEQFRNVVSGGIVDFQVNCIYKDSKGFIWSAGGYKVQRFDGKNFVIIDIPQGVGKVNTIAEDSIGQLFFGTFNGLFVLKRNNSIIEPFLPLSLTDNIYSIHIDSRNTIYAGTDAGLVVISNNSVERVMVQNHAFPYDRVLSVDYVSEQLIWLLTPGGVVALNPVTKKQNHFLIETKNKSTYCTSMVRMDSTIYVGTNGDGIFSFDTSTGSAKPFINIGNGAITAMVSDGHSSLVAGTAGTGIYQISTSDKNVMRSFNSNPESTQKISSNFITTLLVDDFHILWVGSSEMLGFDYIFLHPKPFMIYSTPSFSTYNVPINKFYLGDGFKLLTGLYGFYYISEKDGLAVTFEAGVGNAKYLKPGNVLSIEPYNNKLILGGECGIYVFDPADLSLNVFEPLASLSSATIYHLKVDSAGNLWVASSEGLSILRAGTNQVHTYNTMNSSLPDDLVRFVYFDRHSRIWACTPKGVRFWDDSKKEFHQGVFPNGFIHDKYVHFMMEDKKGNFLFCYNDRNALFADKNFTSFRPVLTEDDAGFTGLRILKILQEESGAYWFVGSRGAIKANESLTDFEPYSVSEGLYEPYATDGVFDNNGRLWLSDNKGLYYASGRYSRLNAPMVITDIMVNGVSEINALNDAIDIDKPIVFDHNRNSIEFQFALLDYTRPDLMVYECKLVGVDEGWNILRGMDKMQYKNLKPGNYTFVVRHNMDKKSTKEVHFVIKPRFSMVEIALMLIVMFALGWYVFIYARKRARTAILQPESLPLNKPSEQKYQFNKISQDKANEIISRLNMCMDEKQLYLNEDLNISDLAREIECTNQMLSQVFSLFLNEKYNDFINRYRVDEFKRIISVEEHAKYTLKSLSQKCGFSSYTSFYRAFREHTGMTPNDFIKNSNA